MKLARYALKRLVLLIPVVIGVSIISFGLLRILPGDPVRTLLPQTYTEADVDRVRHEFGLDRPLVVQYVHYVRDIAGGDFGTSFQTRGPVLDELTERLWPTLELVTCALLVAVVAGVALGVASALRVGKVTDHVLRVGSLATNAMPEFWLGLILIMIFYYRLDLAPVPSGRVDSGIDLPTVTHIDLIDAVLAGNLGALRSVAAHLLLPVLTLALVSTSLILRNARASALAVIRSDVYACAEAHGLRRGLLVRGYVVRETLVGIPTVAALIFGNLIGGAVLVEKVFSWQGLGQWALQGMQVRDYPVVQAFVLVTAVAYVIIFLIADIAHAALDPRVRLS